MSEPNVTVKEASRIILDPAEQRRIMRARQRMIARRKRELKANAKHQRWLTLTQEERAREIIELMTKNHMEHARMLGRFGDETKLRTALAKLAVSQDIFHEGARMYMKEHVY